MERETQLELAGKPDTESAVTSAPTLKEALARLARQVNKLTALASVKSNSPGALSTLEAAMVRLPARRELLAELDEALDALQDVVYASRREQVEQFGRLVSSFINGEREAGRLVRETARGWRVRHLEMELRKPTGQARALYNDEVVVPWTAIRESADLEALLSKAENTLESSAVDPDSLAKAFSQAYRYVLRERTEAGKSHTSTVPIADFYREVRAALVRVALAGKKPESKVVVADMPRWAFLYNMDRYRRSQLNRPGGEAFRLITGSQQEISKGMGFRFGGLNDGEAVKDYCHIEPLQAGA